MNAARKSLKSKRKISSAVGPGIRERLVEGALAAFAEHGIRAARIQQITKAAGVGFGSFYNHFEDRDDLLAAVIEEHLDSHVDKLRKCREGIEDPAERVAIAFRHTVLRALQDPLWAKFLGQYALISDPTENAMLADFTADLFNGLESGRFERADPPTLLAAVTGVILGIQTGITQGMLVGEQLPAQAALLALRTLGVPQSDREEIVNRPLPAVDDE
jgi:AcrR family transcriptional regulator